MSKNPDLQTRYILLTINVPEDKEQSRDNIYERLELIGLKKISLTRGGAFTAFAAPSRLPKNGTPPSKASRNSSALSWPNATMHSCAPTN